MRSVYTGRDACSLKLMSIAACKYCINFLEISLGGALTKGARQYDRILLEDRQQLLPSNEHVLCLTLLDLDAVNVWLC